jgi:hypothetical protein
MKLKKNIETAQNNMRKQIVLPVLPKVGQN